MPKANQNNTTPATPDPVFALIEAHQSADTIRGETIREFNRLCWIPGGVTPEIDRHTRAIEMAEWKALAALVDARPASKEGSVALISYMGVLLKARSAPQPHVPHPESPD